MHVTSKLSLPAATTVAKVDTVPEKFYSPTWMVSERWRHGECKMYDFFGITCGLSSDVCFNKYHIQ